MNRLPIPTEEQECIILVDYLNNLKTQGKVKLFTHVPNETYTTSWSQKKKNSRMGVTKGLPDYVILTPKTLLFLEMKRTHGGSLGPEQKAWIEGFLSIGVNAKVARGFDEAKKFIDINL